MHAAAAQKLDLPLAVDSHTKPKIVKVDEAKPRRRREWLRWLFDWRIQVLPMPNTSTQETTSAKSSGWSAPTVLMAILAGAAIVFSASVNMIGLAATIYFNSGNRATDTREADVREQTRMQEKLKTLAKENRALRNEMDLRIGPIEKAIGLKLVSPQEIQRRIDQEDQQAEDEEGK